LHVRRALLGEGNELRPLLGLEPVCELARAVVRERRLAGRTGGLEALLIPGDDDCFAIEVDPTPRGGWQRFPHSLRADLRRHRLRFRIGHELAHTFFYWREGGEPERHLRDSAAQEQFCDTFARALLLPGEAAAERPATAASILSLQREFDVSLEVAARATAETYPDAELALWHWNGPRTRLQWATHARSTAIPTAAVRLAERRQALLCQVGA